MAAYTLAFMNQKGGVGKTTTVAAIGALLAAEHGKRVLLVDLDPQCNLSDHFGVDQTVLEQSVFNILIDGADPRGLIHRRHGVDLLPASIDLGGAELLLASMMMRELRLKNSLAPLLDDYDYVLLDCPPSLGLLTISGLALADAVAIPMQAEFLALRGLAQLMKTIEIVHDHLNPDLDVHGVVFCMYDPRTHLARDVRAEVERHFPGKVYPANVRKNIRLAEAPSHGLPINLYDPTCSGTADYREVVAELLKRRADEGHPSAPRPASPPRANAVDGPAPAAGVAAEARVASPVPVPVPASASADEAGSGSEKSACVTSAPTPPSSPPRGLAPQARPTPPPREEFQRQPIWRGDVIPAPPPPPEAEASPKSPKSEGET